MDALSHIFYRFMIFKAAKATNHLMPYVLFTLPSLIINNTAKANTDNAEHWRAFMFSKLKITYNLV